MTAETIVATRAAANFPVYKGAGAGALCVAYGVYEIAAGNLLEADDVLKMCKVPAGATVVGGYVGGDDIDTGTEALDIDVGWAANGGSGTWDAADEDGFGNLAVLTGDVVTELKPVAGIYFPLQGKLLADDPITFTRETTIQLDVNAAANAGGTGTLFVVAYYVCP